MKSRSKFNVSNKNKEWNGIRFDSMMELQYYRDVLLPGVADGSIVSYELQKKYVLQPKCKYHGKIVREIYYLADFYVVYSDGTSAVIDVKGMPTEGAKLKRKMFMYQYPDENLIWVTYKKNLGGWVDCSAKKDK